MQPRDSIFDSASEKELFDAVSGSWEPRYRVYPHIPFANLLDLAPNRLAAGELAFLHKTTVDYVLVESEGRPLLAIEFDGIGHGISRHGRYLQKITSPRDRNRAWKLNLKVRVARESGFPFLVVSYDEKLVVEEETNLTVLHGIVGQFLAGRHIAPRVQELIEVNQEALSELTESERDDEIQDMVIAAEIDADMEFNPICRRAAELSTILSREYGVSGCSFGFLEEPVRPSNCYPGEANFDESVFTQWWNNIDRIGCVYRLQSPIGEISRTVWVRNFDGSGVTPFGFVQDLAELITCRAALTELRADDVTALTLKKNAC